jgi:formate hydrogenlyase subunit 6/NADH:ubiquinone oxidoreductase subunit I
MKIFTMSKTVALNLASGPATLMYPKKARVYTPITRGRIENDIDRCIFCTLCGRRCPCYAISVNKESKEWQIDRLKCCICNLCVEVCPVKSLSTGNHFTPPVTGRTMGICLMRPAELPPEGEGEQPKT